MGKFTVKNLTMNFIFNNMRWCIFLAVSLVLNTLSPLKAQDTDNHPRWFKIDKLVDGQYIFYCQAVGDDEESTIQAARAACLQKMCYLFGEEITASTVVEETLTDTKINTKIVNACPNVRIVARKEKRKSVDCFDGLCSAFIMQSYPEKEYKKEWERLNRPQIAPQLKALLKSTAEPPPEKKASSAFIVQGNIETLWQRGLSHFSVLLDGKVIYQCSRDNLQNNCNFNIKVSAGEHIVGIYTYNRKKHALLAKKTVSKKYWFPADAQVLINLDSVTPNQEKDLANLPYERKAKHHVNNNNNVNIQIVNSLITENIPKIDSCKQALWSFSSQPTCRSKDIKALKYSIDRVKQFCLTANNDLPSNTWANRLLEFSETNLSEKPLNQCYTSSVIKYMPYVVKQTYKDMWPAPFSNMTTWSWARSLPNKIETSTKLSGQGWLPRLIRIEQSLPDIAEKLTLTHKMIELFNAEPGEETKRKFNHFFNILANAPFDLDPVSTYGHFNHYLLNSSFKYKIPRMPEFSKRLAHYIQSEPKINCGNKFYTYYVFRYFKSDNKLSKAEEQAVEVMIKNSPSILSQKRCHSFLQ